MPVPSKIIDPVTGMAATVTDFGQLVVAPVDYSTVAQQEADTINTAFNLIEPTYGQQVVVTDIILSANRNVGVNDATVDLYTATAPDTTTVDSGILSLELEKNGKLVLTGLNLITTAGKWINIKTNDATIFATIMYYRVPLA